MSVVGFDFGTTNSLISIITGNKAIDFLDDNGLPVPSVVCYEGSKKIVGREAKERLGSAGLGIKGNVVRSPKIFLDQESVYIEGVKRAPVDIVRDVVQYVAKQACLRRSTPLSDISQAVVTIPVNTDGRWRAALRDSFRLAGISIVQFVHEPLAALYGFFRSQANPAASLRQYNRELILVFDWGGGTLDLTLCRLVDGMLIQIRNDGTDEVGGDKFDEVLRHEIVRRDMKARKLEETVQIHPDAHARMVHSCERAKIDLSSRNSAILFVRGMYHGIQEDDLDYRLTRSELEEITSPLLHKGLDRIRKLLEEADVAPAQIAMCLATGGMANMPAVKDRLYEWFGPQRVQISDRSATLIAEGAAWIAHDHARLHLAKHVELLLARSSYMPLIKAGVEMPSEGEVRKEQFHLYCADPRDGYAKFQFCAPVRPGEKVMAHDRRNPLDNLIVNVDAKARPFQERLELDVQIDDNLILKAQARSLNMRHLSETEVHNLEFGLTFSKELHPLGKISKPVDIHRLAGDHRPGDLVIRSNIAPRMDLSLVPGELLYTYFRQYFDTRHNPPRTQVEEKLYYEPCLLCGRAANDPLCRCASLLSAG